MMIFTHALSAALLHFLWQGTLVAFLVWVVLAILRGRSAELRYVVSCAAFAIMSVLPVITAFLTYRASARRETPIGRLVGIPRFIGPEIWSAPVPPAWIGFLEAWVLPVWFAGVILFAIRLFWSSRHVAQLRSEGEPAEASLVETVCRLARRMNIHRHVGVLVSTLTDAPSVAGCLRPVVLVPAAAVLSISVEQLEAVLAHELAHVRRHDYLVNLLQSLAETLLFYHPAIWWLSSRIRQERELCCDDAAVEICGNPVAYARTLAKLERLRVIKPELAMSSASAPLLYRIQRLTGAADEQRPSKIPALLAAFVAFICLATNLPWAQGKPQNGEAEVSRNAIWMDTVKFGDLSIAIPSRGTMVAPDTAELNVATVVAGEVKVGQIARIELRRGMTIAGKVSRIDSHTVNGTVTVTVELETSMPEFANQPVDGIIQVRTLNDVVYLGRPVSSEPNSESTLFKVESDGNYATRVKVRFGESSVNKIEIREGLQPGEHMIISDMSKYDDYDRIHLR